MGDAISHTITRVHDDKQSGPILYRTETVLRDVPFVIKGEGASLEHAHVRAMNCAAKRIEATGIELEQARTEMWRLVDENARLIEALKVEKSAHEATRVEHEEMKKQCKLMWSTLDDCTKRIAVVKEQVVGIDEPVAAQSSSSNTPTKVQDACHALVPLPAISPSAIVLYSLIVVLGSKADCKVNMAACLVRAIADESGKLRVFYSTTTCSIYSHVMSHLNIEGRDLGIGDCVSLTNAGHNCRGILLYDTVAFKGAANHFRRLVNAKDEGVAILRTARTLADIYPSFSHVSYNETKKPVMIVLTHSASNKVKKAFYLDCMLERFFESYGGFSAAYDTHVRDKNGCIAFTDDATGAVVRHFCGESSSTDEI